MVSLRRASAELSSKGDTPIQQGIIYFVDEELFHLTYGTS
jgi:hypothetical protein